MTNVVELNKPEPMLWVCDCGCSTFELLSDGTARCAGCNASHDGMDGGWLEKAGDKRTKYAEGDIVADVQGNGSVEFARRRLAKIAADDDVSLLIVAKRDGAVSVWSEAETEAQLKWVKKRIKIGKNLILRNFSKAK